MRSFCGALLVLLALPALGVAQGVETIYIVAGSHLDIGFTDVPSAVRAQRIRTLDQAIDLALADRDFHWLVEGGWAFHAWWCAHRGDKARLAAVRGLLARGQLAVGATWVDPHAGLFPGALDLLTVHHELLAKEFGYHPVVAVLNDPPSYPEALVDMLADRGVRYLLIGANLSFSPALPGHMAGRPFWWQSARGKRVLTFIDPQGYTAAFTRWGVDPATAHFFARKRFPARLGALATMEAGIHSMLAQVAGPYDALVVQHSFDNWSAAAAGRLPDAVRAWNDRGREPRLVLASPQDYFRHLERRYAGKIPVQRGEWGGDWGTVRASCPVWTWRVRQALKALDPKAPFETRAALATVMGHSFSLGGGWPGYFTARQTRANAREVADLFAEAVGPALREALPPPLARPDQRSISGAWKMLLAGEDPAVRLRSGRLLLGPFVGANAARLPVPIEVGADASRLAVRARIDRARIPSSEKELVAVVIELPLRAEKKALSLIPRGALAAARGEYLRGAPPAFVLAPDGLQVRGLAHPLAIHSPLVFAWTLVPDSANPAINWLQGLVVRQCLRCTLKGGSARVFPLAELYPGEPRELVVDIALEILD